MFKPGPDPRRNNKGRPKKAKNKSVIEIQNALTNILEGQIDSVLAVLENLKQTNPSEYLKYTLKLSEFVLPRRSTINANLEGEVGVKLNKIEVEVVKNEKTESKDNKDLQ